MILALLFWSLVIQEPYIELNMYMNHECIYDLFYKNNKN